MEISNLIKKLQEVLKKEGNMEVMIEHFDGVDTTFPTTVENLFIRDYTFIGEKTPTKVLRLTL